MLFTYVTAQILHNKQYKVNSVGFRQFNIVYVIVVLLICLLSDLYTYN